MKKIISLVLSAVAATSLLVGCGQSTSTSGTTTSSSGGGYKDGTYTATYDNFDSHGWKGQIEIAIKDSKISTVKFDYVDKNGKLKSQDAAYEKSMKAQVNIGPEEYTVKLNDSLLSKQDVSKVDTVTGATSATNDFKGLAKAALAKAQTGDTSEATLKLPQ